MSKINPQPQKLTLQQALDATSKPLKRWGDLIHVNDFTRYINGTLMRSTFLPDQPNLMTCETREFERNFTQPATENYLRELYAAGGWIESIADFSDEALALYFNYQGGKFRDNIFAGDVGDPSRFVSDCKEALDQINQATQRDVKVIRNTALIAHKKDRLPAVEGQKFHAGRKSNTGSVIRKAIAKLLQKDQALKNPALWSAIANKPPKGWTAFDNKIGKYLEGKKAEDNMSYARFCNVCGEERNKIKQ